MGEVDYHEQLFAYFINRNNNSTIRKGKAMTTPDFHGDTPSEGVTNHDPVAEATERLVAVVNHILIEYPFNARVLDQGAAVDLRKAYDALQRAKGEGK